MIKRSVIILGLVLFCIGMAEAGDSASLYLYPRIGAKNGLCMGDIATIQGDSDEIDRLSELPVKEELYLDGYLDAEEINGILGEAGIPCIIYGSAVRIVPVSTGDEIRTCSSPLIKRGDPVTFVTVHGPIRIQVTGTALCDGMKGDDVSVRTRGKSVLSGKAVDRKTVEAGL